jgi:hypothetical protein
MTRPWLLPLLGALACIVSLARWWVGEEAPLWLEIGWLAALMFVIVSGVVKTLRQWPR